MIRMLSQNCCFNENIDDGIQYLDKPAKILGLSEHWKPKSCLESHVPF